MCLDSFITGNKENIKHLCGHISFILYIFVLLIDLT